MSDLRTALSALLDHYVALVDSGDAGHWNAEDEHVVKQARAALAADQQPFCFVISGGRPHDVMYPWPEMPSVAEMRAKGWTPPYTSAPTANEIDRLRDLNRQLVDKANGYVIHNARLDEENQRLRAELAAPTAQPLTDEQIKAIHNELCDTVGSDFKTVARAVERAHGIGGTHG